MDAGLVLLGLLVSGLGHHSVKFLILDSNFGISFSLSCVLGLGLARGLGLGPARVLGLDDLPHVAAHGLGDVVDVLGLDGGDEVVLEDAGEVVLELGAAEVGEDLWRRESFSCF